MYDELDDLCSVYSPDLSIISEDSDISVDKGYRRTNSIKKHKLTKTVITHRLNRTATSTTPERSAIKEVFKNYFIEGNDDVPTLETCQEFVNENDALKNRTTSQIRAWIIE
ncbi:hypothetical protein NQ314_014615 [Rhamnusium bicolor]|uniref:Transposase n=1 Tax=Rhamnusium bicolor TaxID=1586634 RepID=A0AAV8X1C8_9CUCU|nr:hypothetical protein NQ314_014615 [Rhamnusium bicolor]